jgi:competence ComEA-like helix-hairpin-helix protein
VDRAVCPLFNIESRDATMRNMKIALLLASAFAIPLALAQPKLPDGEGKEVVERLCLKCHGPENFVNKKYTKDGWDEVIYSMQSRGLTGTDQEFETIARYCARYLGKSETKVNVNRATAKELESALRLPSDQAEAIVRYRGEKGEFHAWQEVAKVPGVDSQKIEENKDRLTF